MRKKLLCILVFTVAVGSSNAIFAQINLRDSLRHRSYIKFSVLPVVASIVSAPHFLIGLQYERLIKPGKKFSNIFSIDYAHYTLSSSLLVRPGIQYYFGREPFKGFYTGLYPLFYGVNYEYGQSRYFGGGLLAGFKFFIFKKLTFEINVSFNAYTGLRPVFDQYGNVSSQSHSQLAPYADILIGFPVGKKR